MEANPSSQHGLSYVPLGSAQSATNHRSLCSSYQLALGEAQAETDFSLHQRLSQEAPEQINQVANFRLQQCITQLAPQMAYTKGSLGRH